MPPPDLQLSPSRLVGMALALLFAVTVLAAVASNHPWTLKLSLLLLVAGLLLRAWRGHGEGGLRRLSISPSGTVRWQLAGQPVREGRYAGHAHFGALATFVYVEREGWRRIFGPDRLVVPVDSTDTDAFRRLRAWVRLGL